MSKERNTCLQIPLGILFFEHDGIGGDQGNKRNIVLFRHFVICGDEILVVDDLKPGYDMARGGGAHFAAAGWAYDVPEIAEFMRKNCDYYLESVEELKALLDEA